MVETQDNSTLLYNWVELCEKENIILSFKGDFNQDLVNAILLLAERESDVQSGSTLIRARVFSIMVECMQNIRKYGAVSGVSTELKPGLVLVCKTPENYSLKIGNLILTSEIPKLKEHLQKIKTLNKEDLKGLHKKVLSETKLSEKSGAGLGLISIARKSDSIDYEFRPISDTVSFYSINVTVLINGNN